MNLDLPERFKKRLQQNASISSGLSKVMENIEYVYFSLPDFFPEYTLHGIEHINRVLFLSDKLIPRDEFELLSEQDLLVLALAIMLHDMGLYINRWGISALLYGSNKRDSICDVDDLSWEEEWRKYLQEIEYYSTSMKTSVFGSANFPAPSSDTQNLSPLEVKIYGEFVRKHHGRLAHEISLNGFVGAKNLDLFQPLPIDSDIRDLVGLLARSHNIDNVRDIIPHLKRRYEDYSSPKSIPIFYLVGLLRIADFLSAGSKRAPKVLEAIRSLKSVESQNEWAWNQAIDDDFEWEIDKSTLRIQANPASQEQFYRIESWLHIGQSEIDRSCTVLDEMYSGKWDFTVRHISSNILYSQKIPMRILISWSGPLSRDVGIMLRELLSITNQAAEVIMSTDDVKLGANWKTITELVERCQMAIVCVTSENVNSHWLMFECGILSQRKDSMAIQKVITPLMIDTDAALLRSSPLSYYQTCNLTKDSIRKLILWINGQLQTPLMNSKMITVFNAIWPVFEKKIEDRLIQSNKYEESEKSDEFSDLQHDTHRLLSKMGRLRG